MRLLRGYVPVLILFFYLTSGLSSRSFLWELDNNGEKSYILGSIHMLKKDVYPLKKELEEAFSNCDILAVEADISTEKMGEILKVTMDMAGYRDGSGLKDHISPETYALAEKKMDELGMSIDYFGNFKPWFLAMTVTSMEIVRLGFDPNIGVDKYFINKAEGKTILELEGIPFQLGIFEALSDRENDLFLLSSLKEADSLRDNVDSMVSAWRDGDTETIEKILKKNRDEQPELSGLFDVIIDQRNVSMTGKIEEWIRKGGTYYIIAGAAHLVGENGIISLLKKKGFMLRQI